MFVTSREAASDLSDGGAEADVGVVSLCSRLSRLPDIRKNPSRPAIQQLVQCVRFGLGMKFASLF